MLSGHVSKALIDRAIRAGAWGYVAKGDGEQAMLEAVAEVMAGEFVISAGVRTASAGDP